MAHEFDCGKGCDWLIDFYFPPTYILIQTINKQKLLLLLDKYVIIFKIYMLYLQRSWLPTYFFFASDTHFHENPKANFSFLPIFRP